MKERIIPGVSVSVVKEVVPPQLAPSGVLGLIGLTETTSKDADGNPDPSARVSSMSRFIEVFGRGSAYSMPEARQALSNGVFELVVCPVGADKGTKASVVIALEWPAAGEEKAASEKLKLLARVAGPWANDLKVEPTTRRTADGAKVFDLAIQRPGSTDYEVHRNLVLASDNLRWAGRVLDEGSGLVTVVNSPAKNEKVSPSQDRDPNDPSAGVYYLLAGGKDAAAADYMAALSTLRDESDVDMVLAAVQDGSRANKTNLIKVYDAVISHCQLMAGDSKGRIGFGHIARGMQPGEAAEMVGNLVSDRFVLVAPHGIAGAVAGRIGGLSYFQSPTFKNIGGLGAFAPRLTVEDQRALLKAHVVPVVNERGRGIIVLRGLTTDGDQINVRRVADRAVRGVKLIGDLFIGRLNTEDGRNALKQKLIEFLTQMEKDGALVPSTDGTDPAFKVDVYSSQADFAKGIVRVDMAVRPVRAIDYIYATVLVQV